MNAVEVEIRTANEADWRQASTFCALRELGARPTTFDDDCGVQAAWRGGELRAVGMIELGRTPNDSNAPCLIIAVAESADPATDIAPLVESLVSHARRLGANRVVVGCDPMFAPMLRMYERLGFRPSGRLPYFERGPGQVDYVNGYQDATGSILDLTRSLQ